jgi:hypothetical protein
MGSPQGKAGVFFLFLTVPAWYNEKRPHQSNDTQEKEIEMRKQQRIAQLGMAILVIVLAAPIPCSAYAAEKASIEDVKRETQELLEALESYGADQRDEAVSKTRSALERLDNRIDSLEARIDSSWEQMSTAARQNTHRSISALRKQRVAVAEWYGGLKSSSSDAWDHMKNGLSEAYRELSEAWEQAEQEFDANR